MSSKCECPVEDLWIKATKGCNRYIIGAVYRHPGYKINYFTAKLDNIFNKKYVLWNVHLPNALNSVCLNRLTCT